MAENLKSETTVHSEHGSIPSYIIGFILSLVLTVIPYYMVTRHVISGNALLLAILGIGVAQMLVQILFFLHLGRGPKPFYNVVFFVGTACMITMVIGASIIIMNNLHHNMSPQEVTMRLAQDENIAEVGGQQTGACQGNNANHVVVIKGDEILPKHTDATRCDTLTFTIEDDTDRMIMFGPHDNPSSYGGMYDVVVRSDRSEIITLNENGDFSFHDHSNPDVTASFSVQP